MRMVMDIARDILEELVSLKQGVLFCFRGSS